MEVKNWEVKDINFRQFERERVTKHARRLIENGWLLYEGLFNDDGLIEGRASDYWEDGEEIQLNRNKF